MGNWTHEVPNKYDKARMQQRFRDMAERKSRLQLLYCLLFAAAVIVILFIVVPIPDSWIHDVVGPRTHPDAHASSSSHSPSGPTPRINKRDTVEVAASLSCAVGHHASEDTCVRNTYFPDPYDSSMVDASVDVCDSPYKANCGAYNQDALNAGTHAVFTHLRALSVAASEEIIHQELENSPHGMSNPVKDFYDSCVSAETSAIFSVDEGSVTRQLLRPMSGADSVDGVLAWMSQLLTAGVDTPFYVTLLQDKENDGVLVRSVVPGRFSRVETSWAVEVLSSVVAGGIGDAASKAVEFLELMRRCEAGCGDHTPVKDAGLLARLQPFVRNQRVVALACPTFFSDFLNAVGSSHTQHAAYYLAYKTLAAARGVEPSSSSSQHTDRWNSFHASHQDYETLRSKTRGSPAHCRSLTRVLMERHLDAELSAAAFSGATGTRLSALFETQRHAVADRVEVMYKALGVGEETRRSVGRKIESILLVLGDSGRMQDALMKGDHAIRASAALTDNVWAVRGWYMRMLSAFMDEKEGGSLDVEWHEESLYMPPQVEPVAYYSHDLGAVVVTAAMAGSGMFSPAYSAAALQARIGFLLAHEIAHASDAEGVKNLHGHWPGRRKDILSLEDGMACAAAVVQSKMKQTHGFSVPAVRIMNEVWADVVAAGAVVSHPGMDAASFLRTFSQAFCAPLAIQEEDATFMRHPFSDVRCDVCVAAWAHTHAHVACGAGSQQSALQRELVHCNIF